MTIRNSKDARRDQEAVTQEKLEQRAEKFQRTRVVSAKPDYLLFAEFARAELQKAAEIAEQAGIFSVSREIRKLME